MNRKFALKTSFRICAALALGALTPPFALAQPTAQANPQLGVVVAAGADGAGAAVTLRANDTSAAAILSLVAAKTGARIVVLQDAPIGSLEVQRASLPDAIRRVAQSANLKFETDRNSEIYTIGEIKSRPGLKSPATPLDMNFMQISAFQIVDILSQHSGIKARVDPQAPTENLDIAMHNTTASEALQLIADAADLEVTTTADGYFLKSRAK